MKLERTEEHWTRARSLYRAGGGSAKDITVRVLLADGIHFSEGVVVAWTPVRLQVRCMWGVAEFHRSDGKLIQPGGNHAAPQPRILLGELRALNRKIRELLTKKPRREPAPQVARSSHVLVAWNEQGGIVVEGGGQILPLLVQAGYDPQKTAEQLEAIFAWAEAQAALSSNARTRGRTAGRASAARRKTTRTNKGKLQP